MEQYRAALMRRMQGAIPGQDPQQTLGGPPMQEEGGLGEGGALGQLGAPPGQMEGEGDDIGSIVKNLMQSRFSRRVIGRGPGQ